MNISSRKFFFEVVHPFRCIFLVHYLLFFAQFIRSLNNHIALDCSILLYVHLKGFRIATSIFKKNKILLRWNWWLLKITHYKMRKTHKLEALFARHDHRKCGTLLKLITRRLLSIGPGIYCFTAGNERSLYNGAACEFYLRWVGRKMIYATFVRAFNHFS